MTAGNLYATDGRCIYDERRVCDGTFRCPVCRRSPKVEQTAQGPQLVIPGGERSAHQAAASRDAAGNGRIHARKPQQEPGGPLFSYSPPQPSLFDE